MIYRAPFPNVAQQNLSAAPASALSTAIDEAAKNLDRITQIRAALEGYLTRLYGPQSKELKDQLAQANIELDMGMIPRLQATLAHMTYELDEIESLLHRL